MNKLYIETLGCAMNVRDSEHIIAELKAKKAYKLTDDIKEADLIIINTCSVREKPVNKLFSEIGTFRKIKKSGAKIGVCGCTASHLGKEIIKKAPEVNFVLGARNVSKITEAIEQKGFVQTDTEHDESQFEFNSYRSSEYKALINISIGCDKSCTFCIVPKTRGAEVSIPVELILNEARKASQSGAKEIFLLGQNVNNYKSDYQGETVNFTKLLRLVSEIESIKRIRFTSPHPLHMDDEFLEEFANNPKICKSMHMPLQSGSTKVLKEMRRGYSKEWFLNRAQKLRDMISDVKISTDIIVAFPTETQEDFKETLEVMKTVQFEQIFSFKYSPRPHTPAQHLEPIDSATASERLSTLQALQDEILDTLNAKEKNRVYEVYFEELRANGYIAGRSDNNTLIKVKGSEELLGTFAKVKITKPARLTMEGEIVH